MKKLGQDQLNIALNSKAYETDYKLAKQVAYTLGLKFVGVKKEDLIKNIADKATTSDTPTKEAPKKEKTPKTTTSTKTQEKAPKTAKTPKKDVDTVPLNTLEVGDKFRYKNSKIERTLLEKSLEGEKVVGLKIKNAEGKENNLKAERELEYPVVIIK